jgi:hypothetical protein
MSGELRVALVAGIAAVGGAVVGGAATYLGNQAILSKQLDREERQQKTAARGVARVYAEQVVSAAAILRGASTQDRWPGRNNQIYFELPAMEDRRLVQSRLSLRSAANVSAADQVMRGVSTIIDVEPGHGLNVRTRPLVASDTRVLERGAVALGELGE